VIKLVKVVVPVPSVVLLSNVVGFGEIPQQIPLAVILLPPSLVILPPPVAVVLVILIAHEWLEREQREQWSGK
jgi:hypothetical protein